MNSTKFCWVSLNEVPMDVIQEFDCGNDSFNEFLKENAQFWQDNGETVTYLIVTEDEKESGVYKRIHGYVSINAMGLLYKSEDDENRYLQCAEIRVFAIAKQLRKHHDPGIMYSDLIFKLVLQNLYELSTKVIGFRAIFLNANHEGRALYENNGFKEITEFVSPTDEQKMNLEGTTPLLLVIDYDMLCTIFA